MSDLISRKDLVRHLVNWQMESFAEVGHEREYNLLDKIIRGVENQPSAYDVDKVISRLEKERINELTESQSLKSKKWGVEVSGIHSYGSFCFGYAIDIVRAGGKE